MKKNILVVAIAAAMIAPATTMAGATFYGHAQVEVTSVDYEDSASTAPDVTVDDNARGRIGMKAVEDLGNGWKGLAVFEFKVDTADNVSGGGNAITGREHMVGIKGPAGQFELGVLKQAYKYTGGVKYDALVTTNLEARGNGGMTKKPTLFSAGGSSSFQKNAFGYRKKLGPIKLSLTYGFETDDGALTASAMFKKGGFEAFLALADSGDSAGATNSYSATKLGGKMKFGGHSIMVQLEQISEETGGVTVDPSYFYVSYNAKVGKNVFVVNYGAYDGDNAKSDLTYAAFAVIHKFTKKTRIYGGFRATGSDDNSRETIFTVGLRKTFKGG